MKTGFVHAKQVEIVWRVEQRDAAFRSNQPKASPKEANSAARGEHSPRVWHSAPTPTASVPSIGSREDAKMWSAGAPTTTREARVVPQTAAVPSLGEDLGPSKGLAI
jgi:hypothetical protein